MGVRGQGSSTRTMVMINVSVMGNRLVGVVVVLLLLSWTPGLQLIPPVEGILSREATVQCVQVGQMQWDYWAVSKPDVPFTIGGKQFEVVHGNMLGLDFYNVDYQDPYLKWQSGKGNNLTCSDGAFEYDRPGKFNPHSWSQIYTNLCSNHLKIRTYLVKQHGRVLRGWLHFEIEITGDTDENRMEFIYVQIRDEAFNAIGEFVSDPKEQCKASNENLLSPTQYQFLPCSATGLREAKTSQALFMAGDSQYAKNANDLRKSGTIPWRNLNSSYGIHFTWRLNEYWCNRHWRFRLDVNLWRGKDADRRKEWDGYYCTVGNGRNHDRCQMNRQITEYWLHPKWFGAADIALPEAELDCSTPAIDYDTGTLSADAKNSWFQRSSRLIFGDDYVCPNNMVPVTNNAYGNQYDVEYKSCGVKLTGLVKDILSFGGRCAGQVTKNTSHEHVHGCNMDMESREFSDLGLDYSPFNESYTEYLNNTLKARMFQCNQTCQVPNISDPNVLKEIQGFPKTNTHGHVPDRRIPVYFDTLKKSRDHVKATTYWQTRKYHGNLCILIVMFIMPVSNFLTRYYKETFMNQFSLGCAPWFWAHMLMCFLVPTFFKSSYDAMNQNVNSFGTSLSSSGVFHRVAGYFFLSVFFIMICLGGLRPFKLRARIVCMAFHSVTGFVLYFLGIILIITSSYIPASPTLHACDPESHLPTGFSITSRMSLVWLIMDLAFHALLTVIQVAADKHYKVRRAGFGLPFVPILPPTGGTDFVGSKFRKALFIGYVSLAFIMTTVTIGLLLAKEGPGHCTLGELSCNLSQTVPGQSSSPFGCSGIALKYYAKVIQKYKINYSEPIF